MNTQGISNYNQVYQTNQSVSKAHSGINHDSGKVQGQEIAKAPMHAAGREFDFSNMTLQEQSNAAQALYDQGYLTMGEMAFMTGRYGLIQHDGQLGGTTLVQANSERFNVIGKMKEGLADVKSQGQATGDVINNYNTLIRKLEVYQYGFSASA